MVNIIFYCLNIFITDKCKKKVLFIKSIDFRTFTLFLRLSINENVSALGQDHPKTHVLIVCQSSFTSQGFELRKAIRESWATDAKNLPVSVIFILVTKFAVIAELAATWFFNHLYNVTFTCL